LKSNLIGVDIGDPTDGLAGSMVIEGLPPATLCCGLAFTLDAASPMADRSAMEVNGARV
jgi:hypothetical protein